VMRRNDARSRKENHAEKGKGGIKPDDEKWSQQDSTLRVAERTERERMEAGATRVAQQNGRVPARMKGMQEKPVTGETTNPRSDAEAAKDGRQSTANDRWRQNRRYLQAIKDREREKSWSDPVQGEAERGET